MTKRMTDEEFEMCVNTEHPGDLKVRDLRVIQRELKRARESERALREVLETLSACSHNPPPLGARAGCNCHRRASAALKKARGEP